MKVINRIVEQARRGGLVWRIVVLAIVCLTAITSDAAVRATVEIQGPPMGGKDNDVFWTREDGGDVFTTPNTNAITGGCAVKVIFSAGDCSLPTGWSLTPTSSPDPNVTTPPLFRYTETKEDQYNQFGVADGTVITWELTDFTMSTNIDFTATASWDGGSVSVTGRLEVVLGAGGCSATLCMQQPPPIGTANFNNSLYSDFMLQLGRDDLYHDAGFVWLYAEKPSTNLAGPGALRVPFLRANVTVMTNTYGIYQVNAPQGLVQVTNVAASNYSIQTFQPGDFSGPDVNGFYSTAGHSPLVTYVVSNNYISSSSNVLTITEQRTNTADRQFQFIYSTNSTQLNRQDLVQPDGTTLSRWVLGDTNDPTITNYYWQTSVGTNIVKYTCANVTYLSSVNLLLTNSIVEGVDPLTETNTFTYYPTNAAVGSSNRVQRIDYPDGNWVYYKYDSSGRVTNEFTAFQSNPPPSPGTEPDVATDKCKLTTYAYSLSITTNDDNDGVDDDGSVQALLPRKTIVFLPYYDGSSWHSEEVSRSFRRVQVNVVEEQQCPLPGALWDDQGNLRTVTYNYDAVTTIETNAAISGRVQSVSHPDGTATYYDYIQTNVFITLESTGEPDDWEQPTRILNGTLTRTETDDSGRVTLTKVFNLESGSEHGVLSQQTYSYSGGDPLGRNYSVTDLAGLVTSYTFACCGAESTTDPDSVVTTYEYDSMKRPSSQIVGRDSATVTTGFTYDGLGRLIVQTRTGTNSATITTSQRLFDVLGRVYLQTNALGGVTSTTDIVTNNQRQVTQSFPDTGTSVSLYYRDKGLQKLTGTAVNPVRYATSVESDGGYYRVVDQEIKLASDGTDTSESVKSYKDGAGRVYKTVYAAASGTPAALSYYNDQGQLWKEVDPDGVASLYVYNAKGERTYSIQALSGATRAYTDYSSLVDGLADVLTNTDRVACTLNSVTVGTDPNDVRLQSQMYIWKTVGSSTSNLLSSAARSANGLTNWNTNFNGTAAIATSNVTTYAGGGSRSTTSWAADGAYSVSDYLYGQLVTVTSKDSGDGQIGQTTYAYDAFWRQNVTTDARTGAATNYFNDMDLVSGTASPVPASGQSSQVTSNYFDNMGRLTGTKLADNTTVTNLYTLKGQLALTYGSRTYPVGYGYDAQGRMHTMTNWTTFPTTGARVTTWNYNDYRGWLDNKRYADDKGPDFTYTDGGRLKTRTWAREGTSSQRIVTTYQYGFEDSDTNNEHGDLVEISYAHDPVSTPTVTYSYDRLGRKDAIVKGSSTCTLTYDDMANVLSEAYSGGLLDGISITNGYDDFSRRTNVVTKDGSTVLTTVTNNYDAAGRLWAIGDGTNSATYSYLANSPLVQQIAFKQSGTLRMTMGQDFDNLNRLTGISNVNASSVVLDRHTYTYNDANQRTAMTNADGTYWKYVYDSLGQVTHGTNLWSDNTAVAGRQFDYAFDDIGNRTSTGIGGDSSRANMRTASYSANNLNQYNSRTVPGYLEITGSATNTATVTVNGNGAYRKDDYFWKELNVDNGNAPLWQAVTNVAMPPVGASPVTNAVLTGNIFVPQTPESFTYDDDGNLTQDSRWTYTWDAENRLINLTSLTNTPTASKLRLGFAYDYRSRRISKKTDAYDGSTWNTTISNLFICDGWNLVDELNASNHAIIRSYLWGKDLSGSLQGAGGVGGLLAISSPSDSEFTCYDANGNVMALVDTSSSAVSAQYEYGSFGELIRATGPSTQATPFLFSTKYQDEETALIYYGYRYYSASTGRWLSRDPIGELTGDNLYTIAANNPLCTVDVIGLCPPGRPCHVRKVDGKDGKFMPKPTTGVLNSTVTIIQWHSTTDSVSVTSSIVNIAIVLPIPVDAKAHIQFKCNEQCNIVSPPQDGEAKQGTLSAASEIVVSGADGKSDTASVSWAGATGEKAGLDVKIGVLGVDISVTPPDRGYSKKGGYVFKCIYDY